MKKLFSVINEVEKLLIKHPILRDNDERLMAFIWADYIGKQENMNGPETWKDIIRLLAKGKLPSHESVSRCRRKLQETNPKLRGEKWIKRHKRAKTIKEEMPSYQCFGDETI